MGRLTVTPSLGHLPRVTSQLPLFPTKYLSRGEELAGLGQGYGPFCSQMTPPSASHSEPLGWKPLEGLKIWL